MRTATRLVLLSLLTVAFTALAVSPALAAASNDDDETTTTTEVVAFEYEPAVIIEAPPADPADQPWTTKFLVPTGIALATVAVFVTVVQYFVRVVRSRYKVVE